MKKMIIAIIMILAITAGIVTYVDTQKKNPAEVEQEAETSSLQTIDYDAVFASRSAEEVAMTIDGTEVTWDEYFYWLKYFGETAEYYMNMYSYYGYEVSWEEYAPMIRENTESQIIAFTAIEKYALKQGVELTEEQAAEIEDGVVGAVVEQFGEDTDENRAEYFNQLGVTEDMYYRLSRINYLYQNCFNYVYGEQAEKVTEEEAINWLKDNQYMYAGHILFATIDLGTMEELGENDKAEKEELAKQVSEELRAITDNEELVKRFKELKQEYCEDSGKESYPDGYVFLTGSMVEEFENGYKALEEYQVSEPILSDYGYHVIIRLPLNADAIMEYSDAGEPLNARQKYANSAYAELMEDFTNSLSVEISDKTQGLNLLDYLED